MRLAYPGIPEFWVIYINKESMEWDSLRDDTDLYRYITGRYIKFRRYPGIRHENLVECLVAKISALERILTCTLIKTIRK